MTDCGRDFLQTRVRAEYERALSATSDCARRVHLELARLYEQRLAQEPARSSRSTDPEAPIVIERRPILMSG